MEVMITMTNGYFQGSKTEEQLQALNNLTYKYKIEDVLDGMLMGQDLINQPCICRWYRPNGPNHSNKARCLIKGMEMHIEERIKEVNN